MGKQTFTDPLAQPLESYLDLLNGVPEDFKNWLKKLGAGGQITSRRFDGLQSCIEDLFSIAGMAEERKAVFLFHDSGALCCFDKEKLEEERLNSIPSLFSGGYGTFCRCAGGILPEIKAYAETHAAFKKKYAEAKKKARENSSAAERMEIYLHSGRPYPPALIAELEEIAESDLMPELLPFLYWGKKTYLAMYRLSRGGAGEDLYRDIPRWNCGSHASLPFIGYAAMKQDVRVPEAVFKGMENTEAIGILTGLFYTGAFSYPCRCFTNWLDRAIYRDFYEENRAVYRECGSMLVNPNEKDKADLFLKYCTALLEQNTAGADLPVVRLFFPGADPAENGDVLQYLNYIDPGRENENAYWRLVKLIAERAARCPAADLLSLERFKTYDRGDIDMASFYIFERYLKAIKPDRETLILLGAYICVMFKNQRIDTPKPLSWLFNCTCFADYCGPFIGEADFLKALLAAADRETFFAVTRIWIQYVVTVWLLYTCRNRKPDPQWPVPTGGETERQFEDVDGENPLYAAALLFSPGEIRVDPVLLDGIWNLFLREKEANSVCAEPGFIPYLCFVRAGEDEDKVEAMIRRVRPDLAVELLVMRYLRINKKFDFDDFILQLDDVDKIEFLPPEAFALHRATRNEAVLRYLERHGTTFEKTERIASRYKGP